MSNIEVTAKVGKDEDSPSATVTFDFGDNLDEAVELFGDEVVYGRFKSAAVIDLQALIRRLIIFKDTETGATLSSEEIQEKVGEWRPGTQTHRRKSTKEKALELLEQMSAEDRAELLKEVA